MYKKSPIRPNTRTITFSDEEFALIKEGAKISGIGTATFLRSGAVQNARNLIKRYSEDGTNE